MVLPVAAAVLAATTSLVSSTARVRLSSARVPSRMCATHWLTASGSSGGTASDCQVSEPASRSRSAPPRAFVREAGRCAVHLDGERVATQEPGLDDTDRAARVSERDDGLVLDRTLGQRGVRGAHCGWDGAEEQLREVYRVASEIAECPTDGGFGVIEAFRQPARDGAIMR